MGCVPSGQGQITPANFQQKRNNKKNVSYKNNNVGFQTQIHQKFVIVSNSLNQQQISFAIKTLESHQLFGSLTVKQLRAICLQMICVTIKQGEYVFKQGDIGNSFFIIDKGQVDVQIDEKFVRSLTKGQTFGQLALLFKCSRTASIFCKKDCQFFIIKPDLYKQTLRKMKLQQHSTNAETINKVPLFACLTNKQKFELSNIIKIVIFNKSDVIFQTGDDAQAIYIISQGNVKIQINGKKDIILDPGQIFGQSSIQLNSKRSGTAIAHTRVIGSLISRKDIETTLGSSINNLIFFNTKKWALMRSQTFKNLSHADLLTIITQFQPFEVKNNETIEQQSYKGFVICLEGSINNQAEGIVFNEEGWKNKTRVCQKLKKNQDGLCCFLSYKKAEKFFDEIKNKKKLLKFQQKKIQKSKNKFNFSDFSIIKKLGQGQFGEVFLVKNIQYGTNLYAIKCLKKQYIRSQQIIESVVQQRQILQKTIFPYIVGYVKAFQDKNYIFLLMEYIHGKQMFDVIRQIKMMSLEMIKYYFGCIMISIQYLHGNNIVYRDIKPQNSVVDSKGKVFLIDLGTAKELNADNFFKTFTIIGTPHYMAPEIFQGKGYSFEVDIWSLGCLLYQFFCLGLPFGESTSRDPYTVYTSIIKEPLFFPPFMKDQKAKKLINSLLAKDPKKRALANFKMIKSHEFFKGFNWTSLFEQQMKSPYIPKDYRNSTMSQLNYIQGKQLLKYIYNSDKNLEIEQWTSDTI